MDMFYTCVYRTGQVHDLLNLYREVEVPPERLLFKIPATWQVSIRELSS